MSSELIFTETDVNGDYPGRLRLVVNELAGLNLRGLLTGVRSRHYSANASAALAYDAEDLDPLDAAAVVSGSVTHSDLATSWTPVLGTNIGGSTFLTHTGSYRVWAKVNSPDGDSVWLRWLYDVGDLTLPEENDPVQIPFATSDFILPLGVVRLDRVPAGSHRWQGQLQARGEVGGENLTVKRIWLQPLDEGSSRLSAPVVVTQGLSDFAARDEFNQTAGALTGKTLPVGGVWTGAGDADDFTVETTGHTAQRTAVSDASGLLGRFVVPGMTAITNQVVKIDFIQSAGAGTYSGVLARYIDINNWFRAYVTSSDAGFVQLWIDKRVAGTQTVFSNSTSSCPVRPGSWTSVRAFVDATGQWAVWVYPTGSAPGEPGVTGQHADLATGGALASGKCGFVDFAALSIANTRNYKGFAAWAPTTDAVLHANQSAQLGYLGNVREDAAGVAYGPVSKVIDSLERVPASGTEARPVEFFLLGSTGDFDRLPDTTAGTISAQVAYNPSYVFKG